MLKFYLLKLWLDYEIAAARIQIARIRVRLVWYAFLSLGFWYCAYALSIFAASVLGIAALSVGSTEDAGLCLAAMIVAVCAWHAERKRMGLW